MAKFEIEVAINKRSYSIAELDRIYDQRAQHVMLEMINLGAVLLDGHGEPITATMIPNLSAQQRRDWLLANKIRIGTAGLKTLYADQLHQSDIMWQEMVAHSDGTYNKKVSRANLKIKGLNILKFGSLAKDAGDDPTISLGANPDHFEVTNDSTGQHGIETMGMFGEPTQMDLRMGIKNLPEPANKHYLKRIVGDSRLANDLEIVNAYAMHQVRPTLSGLEIVTAAYFPSAAPQALVDGHAIHLAIEFTNVFRSIAAGKQ